jgi:2-keto-3-deoxy-L-rhamnonate aldolase RhmA
MTEAITTFRARLAAQQMSMGTFCATANADMVEMLGHAGYDFVVVDLEHGAIGSGDLPLLFRAADCGGLAPLVRIPKGLSDLVASALDAGAAGIIVPAINSAEEGRRMIALTRYPPKGARGVHNSTRALAYSAHALSDALADEQRRPLIVLQIEKAMSAAEIRAVARLDGLDVLFIGVYDLSTSMGLSGQFDHPDVVAQVSLIVAEARAANVALGIWTRQPDAIPELRRRGFSFVTISNTELMFFERARAIVTAARAVQ